MQLQPRKRAALVPAAADSTMPAVPAVVAPPVQQAAPSAAAVASAAAGAGAAAAEEVEAEGPSAKRPKLEEGAGDAAVANE
jgi:hypothetical protein